MQTSTSVLSKDSTRDLGTYHIKVEFENGWGWLERVDTGPRFHKPMSPGHITDDILPLDADVIPPRWESEEDLIHSFTYYYTEGNLSCDCNRHLLWLRSQGHREPAAEATPCGDAVVLRRLTLIRPDLSEQVLVGHAQLNKETE